MRALAIKDYAARAGYEGVVCFSCGNASDALKTAGLDVLAVAPGAELSSERWWDAAEIHRVWPSRLDATSGHLSAPLLAEIAAQFRAYLGDLPDVAYRVPSGSGETLVCLAMAFPGVRFVPEYDLSEPGLGHATRYQRDAPLNALVRALSGDEKTALGEGGFEGGSRFNE